MILYKDYIRFIINSDIINVISDETSYGTNTVIEYDAKYFYLGNKIGNLDTVVDLYQKIKNINFSQEELDSIYKDNNIIKDA